MKPKLIIITGTPGTGKSTLAKRLAKKLGYQRLNLHKHYRVISSGYNLAKQSYDVDRRKFLTLIKKKYADAQRGLVVDSHISHYLPPKMVNVCIVLTCSNLKVLKKRLQRRKYLQHKIRENLDAELFQVCLMEAREQGHLPLVFDTATISIQQTQDAVKHYLLKKDRRV